MAKILIVDDEPAILTLLQYQIGKLGHDILTAENGEDAVALFRDDRPDAVLLDVNLPDLDGLQVLEELQRIDNGPPVLMMTAAYLGGRGVADGMHSVHMAVQALTHGARDYLLKPSDKFLDKLRLSLQSALRERAARPQVIELRQELTRVEASFANIIGDCEPMKEVFEMTEKVIGTSATVLILGESGTGKELIAKAIHFNSPRKDKELVILNCAAITESLLESELFGHEKGSFTGAAARKLGKFEQADGGTIFLDEIGDMPLTTQAKVLRVLQEGEVVRVGGTERISVDVRCLAATHRDLTAMVEVGEFREDLLYRLNVYPIEIPPLRARKADLPLLTAHFLKLHSQTVGRAVPGIDDDALEALLAHDWPGNVRELENVLLRAVILAEGDCLRAVDLPFGRERDAPLSLARIEARAIREALRQTGSAEAAARRLDIDLAELRARAERHKIALKA